MLSGNRIVVNTESSRPNEKGD
ncbi:MAG: hypothetical protein H6Q84_1300, partial [Deltaproteobacteria bacterium]|nr:hypothetical protein [Deltaproteobacteria bacterium]